MESVDINQALASCELFKTLDPSEIGIIANICQIKTYEAGECVYQQGDFGGYLYIISEGRVILERTMNIGSREGRVVIATLGKGRVFGCWSTLLGESHIMMLTTFCQKPSKIIELKGANLRELMLHDTRFGFNVLERLSFLLRDRIEAAYGAMEKI